MYKLLFFTLLFFISCKSSIELFETSGKFTKKKKTNQLSLSLNKDSTFLLKLSYPTKCVGKWTFIGQDSIFLKCIYNNPLASFFYGYMDKREHYVKIINNNKLKINNYRNNQNVILKRRK